MQIAARTMADGFHLTRFDLIQTSVDFRQFVPIQCQKEIAVGRPGDAFQDLLINFFFADRRRITDGDRVNRNVTVLRHTRCFDGRDGACCIVPIRERDDRLRGNIAVIELLNSESDRIPQGRLRPGHAHIGAVATTRSTTYFSTDSAMWIPLTCLRASKMAC